MNRLHVSVAVPDIEAAKVFYAAMFGAAPTVVRPGYAKWMLDDPRVNFVANETAGASGVNHLGIQADDDEGLHTLYERFAAASDDVYDEGKTECCYAKSEKNWVTDPAGMAWEAFRTTEIIDTFGNGPVGGKPASADVTPALRDAANNDARRGSPGSKIETFTPAPVTNSGGGCC